MIFATVLALFRHLTVCDCMLFVWCVAFGTTLIGTWVGLCHLRPTLRANYPDGCDSGEGLQPISILKPLKGLDEDIEKNLESFFWIDYPSYEILFSVADERDPVVPLVRRLMHRHRRVPAKLIIGAVDFGPNPKINNLLRSYEEARHEWVLVSDSNTRVARDTLKRLAHSFKRGIAMQTSVVAGIGASGWGGRLEATFLNTFYARSMLVLNGFGHPCVVGKAMLFRKPIMDGMGGLRSLRKHIAEDYAAGRKLHLLGFKVQLSRDPVHQHIGEHSFRAFWSRHVRWGRLRKLQAPLAFCIEPLMTCLISGIIGAAAVAMRWHVSPWPFLGAHFATWFACDLLLAARVGGIPGPAFAVTWAARELMHMPLWFHIAAGNTVIWRGQLIHLKREKYLEPGNYPVQAFAPFLRRRRAA